LSCETIRAWIPSRPSEKSSGALFANLRRLLHERFEDRPGIASKLDAIEGAIVNMQPAEDIWVAFLKLGELSEDTFGTGFI
jgi:hypothetical protein